MANDNTIKRTISQNISYYRKKAGSSQKEFAAKLGAAPSRISSWETGANSTDIDTLFKICSVLNVSINDICGIYPDSNIILSYQEQELIKKYRNLDEQAKEAIFNLIDSEYNKNEEQKEHIKYIVGLFKKTGNSTVIDQEKNTEPYNRLLEYFNRIKLQNPFDADITPFAQRTLNAVHDENPTENKKINADNIMNDNNE